MADIVKTKTITETSPEGGLSADGTKRNNTSILGAIEGSGITTVQMDTDLGPTIRANSIIHKTDEEFFRKFSRFGYIDPYSRLTGTKEYDFFTKPDLFIFKGGNIGKLNDFCNTSFFNNCKKTNLESLKQLQGSVDSWAYPFMNVLSNARRSNLDLPGIASGNDIETSANLYDTKLSYRGTSYSSDENHEFTLEFEDTKNLDVYMLIKAYDEYERRKYFGYHDLYTDSTDGSKYKDYVANKILHDQFSIFKFIVAEDASTIIYYAKLYGCFFKSVPRDTFSDLNENGEIRFSVNFHATFIEDMEPNILDDFNFLTSKAKGDEMKPYDETIGMVSGEWANMPYIEKVEKSNDIYARRRYKLKWR